MSGSIEKILRNQRAKANELRRTSPYANICFITHNSNRVKADKSYLCTFEWRYTTQLLNSKPNQEISLNNSECKIESDEMEKIIDFIYTGEFDFRILEFSKIIRFHQISEHLMIDYLSAFLEEYLLNNFQNDQSKCLCLWNYAKKLGLKNWEKKVLDYASESANEFLLQNNVFLDHRQYLQLLEHKKFNLDENTKCEYLLQWLDYDKQSRKLYIKDLIEIVDIQSLNDELLLKLLKYGDRIFGDEILKSLLKTLESNKERQILDMVESIIITTDLQLREIKRNLKK